nr:hypothetical protein [Limoniibacter endophyticus]
MFAVKPAIAIPGDSLIYSIPNKKRNKTEAAKKRPGKFQMRHKRQNGIGAHQRLPVLNEQKRVLQIGSIQATFLGLIETRFGQRTDERDRCVPFMTQDEMYPTATQDALSVKDQYAIHWPARAVGL